MAQLRFIYPRIIAKRTVMDESAFQKILYIADTFKDSTILKIAKLRPRKSDWSIRIDKRFVDIVENNRSIDNQEIKILRNEKSWKFNFEKLGRREWVFVELIFNDYFMIMTVRHCISSTGNHVSSKMFLLLIFQSVT